MNLYRAYGLAVSSGREIAALTPAGSDSPRRADVELVEANIDTSGLTFAPIEDGDEAWIAYAWDHGRTVIRFPGVMAEFDIPGRRILVQDSTADADYAEHLILDHVLPRWLSLRGDLVLHGSSVVTSGGGAVALIGDTGLGKSTTATALAMRSGWQLLTDDVCRIIDGPRVVPSYPGVRLTSASRAELTPHKHSTPLCVGADKGRVRPNLVAAHEPAPLRAIIALGENTDDFEARRLGLAEATATLVKHIFHQAPTRDEIALQAFRLTSAIAAEVPCHHLSFPRRWDVFDDLAELLETLDQA